MIYRKFISEILCWPPKIQISSTDWDSKLFMSFCSREHMINKIQIKKVAYWSLFWRGFCDFGRVAKAWISAESYNLIWPKGHLSLFDHGRQYCLTSRCSIYEIPCTKLGFNSILVIILRFPSSHWLIYYPFGISLVTSLVQKNGLRSRVVM